jgi:hypothetical protein
MGEAFLCLDFRSAGGFMTTDKTPKVNKYAPPFSVRLTLAERARLDKEAGSATLGEYVRGRLFESPDTRQRVFRRPVQDAEALGQVLTALGQTRLSNNLYQIVRAVHAGELAVTAEQQKELEEALVNVREMRQCLMAALGMRDGGARRAPPPNPPPPPGAAGVSGSSGGGENP